MEVDETTLPVSYFPGIIRDNSTALTQVIDVSRGLMSVEIPEQMPNTQCLVADDFDMFTTCFVRGPRDDYSVVEFLDENGATQTMIPATSGDIVTVPRPAASSTPSSQNRYLATNVDVGSTNGLAVQDTQNLLYAGAFAKRHSDYGPGGSGSIYVAETRSMNPLLAILIGVVALIVTMGGGKPME